MSHAGNHAHDRVLHLRLVRPLLTQLLANRVLIWKKCASEILINYDDKRSAQDIVRSKNAATQNEYSHSFEIVWRDTMHFCEWFFTKSWLWLTGYRKISRSTKPTKGYIVVDCRSCYARKRLNFLKQLLIERRLSCVIVLQRREFDSNCQKMIWVEPERFVL